MTVINHGAVVGFEAYRERMEKIAKEFADAGDKPNEAVTLMSKGVFEVVWNHMRDADTHMQNVSPELIGRAVSGGLMSWVTAVMPAELYRAYARDIAQNIVESMKSILAEAEADAKREAEEREGATLQ